MQLSLSYEVFRWHPLNIILQLPTLSYVASYLCTIGSRNKEPGGPWPLLSLKTLHGNVIFPIENHFSLAIKVARLATYSSFLHQSFVYSTYSYIQQPQLDIKGFGRMQLFNYRQVTAASDWPCHFLHPRCYCLALQQYISYKFSVNIFQSLNVGGRLVTRPFGVALNCKHLASNYSSM